MRLWRILKAHKSQRQGKLPASDEKDATECGPDSVTDDEQRRGLDHCKSTGEEPEVRMESDVVGGWDPLEAMLQRNMEHVALNVLLHLDFKVNLVHTYLQSCRLCTHSHTCTT